VGRWEKKTRLDGGPSQWATKTRRQIFFELSIGLGVGVIMIRSSSFNLIAELAEDFLASAVEVKS
jgi:hypothetical protein